MEGGLGRSMEWREEGGEGSQEAGLIWINSIQKEKKKKEEKQTGQKP